MGKKLEKSPTSKHAAVFGFLFAKSSASFALCSPNGSALPRRPQNRRDEGMSLLALGLLPGAGVLEGDHAFREGFVFEQGELALREAAGEERGAFADQYGNDADIELVDQIVFEEVAREFAAAH